jgi:hypothetical protein
MCKGKIIQIAHGTLHGRLACKKTEIENPFEQKKATEKKWKLKEEEKKSAHDTQNTWRKAFLPHKRNENLHEIGVFFCWR